MKIPKRRQFLTLILAVLLGLIPLFLFLGRPAASQAAPAAPQANLGISKTASKATSTWDELISYTIVYTIPTGTVMTSTTVVDCLPNNSPGAEPYFTFLASSSSGPTPANGSTPPVSTIVPTSVGGNCWQWALPDMVNTSGADYVYVITYDTQVRSSGSNRGEVGTNEVTLTLGDGTIAAAGASVTVTTPYIYNTFSVEASNGDITDLVAGDQVTLTLVMENIDEADVSPAYSMVVVSLVPRWLTDFTPLRDTPVPSITTYDRSGQSYYRLRWQGPGVDAGVGADPVLAEFAPGTLYTYTIRARVVDDVLPSLANPFRAFGWSGLADWASKYKTLPDVDTFYLSFNSYPSLNLLTSKVEVVIEETDASPTGYASAGEVLTYTVTYTVPTGTVLHPDTSVDIRVPDGLLFGGVISQPTDVFSGPTFVAPVNDKTQAVWVLSETVTATTDLVYTFIYTVTGSPTFFYGGNAGTIIPRNTILRTQAFLQHTSGYYAIWQTPSALLDVLHARPYFDDMQKCLWRNDRCVTGSGHQIEGGKTLVFRIRYTRNGGNTSYSGTRIDATDDAYNVRVWDLLPSGFTLVDAWPSTYTTATIGTQTAITWTQWASVEAGLYIPGVVPPTPSIDESYFVITATAPITLVGRETYINTAWALYENSIGTQLSNVSTLQMLLEVTTSKTGQTSWDGGFIRVGDIVTYTIVDQVAQGGVLFWPRHRDLLPAGMRYITNTLDVVGATLEPPTDPYTAPGTSASAREEMFWRMPTLVNPGTLIHTFQARFTGVDLNGSLVRGTFPTNMRAQYDVTNQEWLEWNTEDASGGYPSNRGASHTVRVRQPLLGDYTVSDTFVKTVLTTSSGSLYVVPGDWVTYELTIRNTGLAPAYDVVLSDTLSADMTFVTYSLALSDSAGGIYTPTVVREPLSGDSVLVWEIAEVPPRPGSGYGLLTVQYVVQVSPDAAIGTVLENAVRIIDYSSLPGDAPYERHYGGWYADIVRSSEPITVTPPVVTVALAKDAPPLVLQGETFTYTLTYTKTGRGVQNAYLTDTLPSDLVYVGYRAVPAVTQVSGTPTPSWYLGALAEGATGQIVITATAPVTLPARFVLNNVAALSADYADTVTATAQSEVGGAILSVVKTASASHIVPGGELVYTLAYSNTGNVAAASAVLTETYDPAVTFVAADPAPTTGTTVWALGDLAPGHSGTVVVTTTVNPETPDGSMLLNEVAFTAANHAPVTGTATVLVVSNEVVLVKTAPATVNAGDLLTYTLAYTASGLHGAVGAVLTESYPPEVTFESAVPAPSSGTNVWSLGTVVPGATGTIHILVRVNTPLDNGTLFTNTAVIAAQNKISDTATAVTTVRSGPVLEISKTSNSLTARPGEPLVYTIHYNNTGTAAATGVVITETYPVSTTFVAADPAPSMGNNVWHLGTVGLGSGQVVVTVTVSPFVGDNSTLVNHAVIDSVDTAPVETSLTTQVRSGLLFLPLVLRNFTPMADLTITNIVVAPLSPVVSNTTVISVTVINLGNVPAQNFWIDLYIDPSRAPQPGDIWTDISQVGKAWLVRETLMPGEELVVNTTQPDDPLNPEDPYSNWPGYFSSAGAHTVYAQVDPYPGATGAVAESSEANNIYGPLDITVTAQLINGVRVYEVPLPPIEPVSPRPEGGQE